MGKGVAKWNLDQVHLMIELKALVSRFGLRLLYACLNIQMSFNQSACPCCGKHLSKRMIQWHLQLQEEATSDDEITLFGNDETGLRDPSSCSPAMQMSMDMDDSAPTPLSCHYDGPPPIS